MGENPVRCRIPELCARLGQNQDWLAAETGHSKQQMSNIVKMRDGRVVTVKKGRLFALKLKCTIDDLYEWR